MIISLGRQLPAASSSLPEADNGTSSPLLLLGLAPGGVCLAATVADSAGGPLTPPFHPHPLPEGRRQYTSLWHYAVESPRLAVSQHRALWRADFPHPGKPRRDHPANLSILI